jgi:hypothetical protein
MAIRGRRFAGMELAGIPVENVSVQLNDALKKLREVQSNPGERGHYGFNKQVVVPGSDANIAISAQRAALGSELMDTNQTIYGNPEQIKLIADKNKGDIYTLSWSVDGSYGAEPTWNDTQSMRNERVKIARAADRGFNEAIKGLPEGSLVENSPVGASHGDFSRADIYMQKGFGPVQSDGVQYGLIEQGKIRPLSPLSVNQAHAEHLAARAERVGNKKLSSAISQELERRKGLKIEDSYISKQGQYDGDYDNYDYDDDYESYLQRDPIDFQRTREENIASIQQDLQRYESGFYSGRIDHPEQLRNSAKNTVDERNLTNPVEAPTSADIAQLREAQISLNQLIDPNNPQVVIGRAIQRPLPQIVTADSPTFNTAANPSNPNFYISEFSRPYESLPNMRELSADQRRAAIAEEMRRSASILTRNDRDIFQPAIDARVNAKREMVDMNRREDGEVGRILQEQYTPTDIQNLRDVQVAIAQRSNGIEHGLPRVFAPDDLQRSRRPSDIFVQQGDRIQNRRALTPEQLQASVELERLQRDQAGVRSELDTFEDGMMSDSGRGRALRAQRDVRSYQELIDGVQPSAAMSGSQALDLVRRENSQPGTVDRSDLSQALVNLRQINNGGLEAFRSAAAGPQAILDQANYGPSAPIQRTTASRLTPPRPPVREALQPVEPFIGQPRRRNARRRQPFEDTGLESNTEFRSALAQQRQQRTNSASTGSGLEALSSGDERQPVRNADLPSDLSLDEFLEVQSAAASGNTVVRTQGRNLPAAGSNNPALARPENRLARRQRLATEANQEFIPF